MEDRQRVQQHVVGREAPVPRPALRAFESEIVVGQHRALGAAGRARGVEDGGQIVGDADRVLEFGRHILRGGAAVQSAKRRRSRGCLSCLLPRLASVADEDGGLCVGKKIGNLRRGIGRVQRDKDCAEPDTPEIGIEKLDAFFDLDDDPAARIAPSAVNAWAKRADIRSRSP